MVSLTSVAVIAAVALLSPLIVRLARLPVPEIVLKQGDLNVNTCLTV